MSSMGDGWKSLRTSYTPGWVEMFESEAAQGDGFVIGWEEEMIAAVVVGKWEPRGVGGISKRSGKPGFGFPHSVFSTTFFAFGIFPLQCAGYDCRPLLRFGA